MAKVKTKWVCQSCGYESFSYLGRCPDCGNFATFCEESVQDTPQLKSNSAPSLVLNSELRAQKINDIKNEELPLQKKLSSILGKEIEIDNEKVNINDYLLSNLEEDITTKVNELIDILIQSKYGSITFYYDNLYSQIINEYKNTGTINSDKIKL